MTTQERKEQRDKVKGSEGLIKTGCNRILKKVKDIRQKFSTALLMTMLEHTFQQKAIYLVMMSFLIINLKEISTKF